MKILKIVVYAWMLMWVTSGYSQSPNSRLKEPEVGKPCPAIGFNTIDYYKAKYLNVSDLKSKWVVIDFWNHKCSACIADFGIVSRTQAELSDKLQYIMVAPKEDRQLYTAYHDRLNLTMLSAFDDDLQKAFKITLTPYIVIVDPNGIVRAVTSSAKQKQIEQLMTGKDISFEPYKRDWSQTNVAGKFNYDQSKPYLVAGNGGADSDFLFRSILSNWTRKNPHGIGSVEGALNDAARTKSRTAKIENLGVSIPDLYKLAYFGHIGQVDVTDSSYNANIWQAPFFEIKDTTVLQPDWTTGENLYCYSVVVPTNRCTDALFSDVIKNDLQHYFNYEVKSETRKMPYFKLVATEAAKINLKTHYVPGEFAKSNATWADIDVQNLSIKDLLAIIQNDIGLPREGLPLVDETGINSNVDIRMERTHGNLEATRRGLQKIGLDLVRGEKEMKVVVVYDSKQKPEN